MLPNLFIVWIIFLHDVMQLSFVKHDLEEMDFLMTIRKGTLSEQLLPTRQPFFIRELRYFSHGTNHHSYKTSK